MSSDTVLQQQRERTLKCIIVGDGNVGKTSCLITYATGVFLTEYIPIASDHQCMNIILDNESSNLHLLDTFGGEDRDRLRPLSYPGTDVFLLAFSVISIESFYAVREKWCPEVKRHMEMDSQNGVPILLVGLKADLRKDTETMKQLAEKGKEMVAVEEAQKLAEEIGAKGYYECSARTQEGLKSMFEEAMRAARVKKAHELKASKKKKSCVIL